MQRVQAAKQRIGRLARRWVQKAGDVTQRSALAVAQSLQARGEALRNTPQAQQLADTVLHAGEQIIDKSPVPVPVLMRDALGRMQDALGQLGNAIEAVDAGASAEAGKDVVAFKRNAKMGQHFQGRVEGADDVAPLRVRHGQQKGASHARTKV